MRPLRLQLRGFTSFREEQSIDLADIDLFAISGPTGSGKTSILDAMTYALFGYIDRVGKQAAQFISQGQPRLAVTLEFAVGPERYRVARSTPARGQTKILLETWNGAGWEQAGEGADRVGEVNARIREAIGLDYDAFTRTVLLPQGKFAEFLVGDAKKRREILTDLLGLELFERLARRAGEVKRRAVLEAETRAHLLEREYAGVTPDALEEAERAAKEAAAAEAHAADVEARVRELAERWAETARSVEDLRSLAAEASRLAAAASTAGRAAEAIAADLAPAQGRVREATGRARTAISAAERAEAAVREARERWGSAAELGALGARAQTLVERRSRLAELEGELQAAVAAARELAGALRVADEALAERVAAAESALDALAAAREAEERAAHADHVAAVIAGVRVGETCPVCGSTIAALRKPAGAKALDKARAARASAERAAAEADSALREASAERDRAERRVREAEAEAGRLEKEIARERANVGGLEAEVARALGEELPDDPAAAVAERLRALEELQASAEAASRSAREAADEVASAEAALRELQAGLAEIRAAVEALPVAALLERAGGLLAELVGTTPRPPRRRDPAALASFAGSVAEALERVGADLAAAADERSSGEAALLEEASSIADGLVPPAPTLAELVASTSNARTEAARVAATAEHRTEALRDKLANAERIVDEASEHRARAARFDALAKELRADRIIAFLQAEALQLLAAAGSRRLDALSGGRYRLEFADDEFSVVDDWNGEERRSARTLSGGETFLASLALALALSEQVRALAVSDHARLDALFLDEGFGTLDPETLEVVVDAIEQLGGDGRMVGVITHVQELALRLPARIEVEKSPRGSSLRVVS